MPRSAARNAAAYPPGPPPITATLRFDEFDISSFFPRLAGDCVVTGLRPVPAGQSPATTHVFSSLNRQQERLLKRFRDPAQKARGVGSVDQPVIVRERQRKNQARLEFTSIAYPLGLHPRTRQAENRNLWIVHDRRKSGTADSSQIGDGKCAAFHFIGRELALTSLLRQLRHLRRQLYDIFLVDVANDRHQ